MPATFGRQLLLAVTCAHLLLAPLVYLGIEQFATRALGARLIERAELEARLLEALVPADFDRKVLSERFYAQAVHTALASAELLVDGSTEPVWTFRNPLMATGDGPFIEDSRFGQHDDQLYSIERLLTDADGAPIGRLRLSFDESASREQADALVRWLSLLAIVYLLLVLLLTRRLVDRLDRPLQALVAAATRIAAGELRMAMPTGSEVPQLQALATDIERLRTELLKKSDVMEHMAMHDDLTGLPNRALLADRVSQAIAQAQRSRSPFALLLIDLDHFREINDSLGHSVGDRLLQMVPSRLEPLLRGSDTLARLGGDEFALVLQGTDASAAEAIAERIGDAMRGVFCVGEHELHVGQSVGIALFPEHSQQLDDLLRQAEMAMYAAKLGRCGHVVFSPEVDPHSRERLDLANELRRDIEKGRLQVDYQPQASLQDGRIVMIDAQVRWRRLDGDTVERAAFVPVAERLGLIDALTRHVVHRALGDLAGDPLLQPIGLTLGITARNLHDRTLPAFLSAAADEFGVAAQRIVLEITEHECVIDGRNALEQLVALRKLGFGIAIDGFGRGNSSFHHLKRLPATELRIDRSVVAAVARDRHARSLVAAIVAFGHQVGVTVVAAGVGDQRTLELLRELGCDRAQGPCVAQPMARDRLLQSLASSTGSP